MSLGSRIEATNERVYRDALGGVTTGATKTGGQSDAVAFPRQFSAGPAVEAWQKETAFKQGLVIDDKTKMTPFGQLQFSERDQQALLAQQDLQREAEFDAWFGERFNKSDLANRQFAQNINKEFYDKREEEMVRRARLALQLKLIQLRGVRTEEDMMLQFGIERGHIVLPTDWDRIGATTTEFNESEKQKFQLLLNNTRSLDNIAAGRFFATRNQNLVGTMPTGYQKAFSQPFRASTSDLIGQKD